MIETFACSKIRFAVCLCFGGAVLSASKIASMTGTSGPSFGRSGTDSKEMSQVSWLRVMLRYFV
jgi:hypothetical protein